MRNKSVPEQNGTDTRGLRLLYLIPYSARWSASLTRQGRARFDGYVADVPYVPLFCRELAPAWLDHVAFISGIQPPNRRDGFTWCDLGCGFGVTAAVLAATHPTGYFYGIDVMPAHIDRARRFASECGIGNIEYDYCQILSLRGKLIYRASITS